MAFKRAEQELEEFLAPLPVGVQLWLQGEFKATRDWSLAEVEFGLRDKPSRGVLWEAPLPP